MTVFCLFSSEVALGFRYFVLPARFARFAWSLPCSAENSVVSRYLIVCLLAVVVAKNNFGYQNRLFVLCCLNRLLWFILFYSRLVFCWLVCLFIVACFCLLSAFVLSSLLVYLLWLVLALFEACFLLASLSVYCGLLLLYSRLVFCWLVCLSIVACFLLAFCFANNRIKN